jgi:hypothetical protein
MLGCALLHLTYAIRSHLKVLTYGCLIQQPSLIVQTIPMNSRKILVVTKTYPSISQRYGETVCTAGILLNEQEEPQQWIRIYPVRYRDLEFEKKYPKWGIIQASIERNHKDYRPESYRIDDTSIKVLRKIGTEHGWRERKQYVSSLIFNSIDEIKSQEKSLGMIRPDVYGYVAEKTDREWPNTQQAILDQGDFLRGENPFSDLEKIPYKFSYRFRDISGHDHKCSIIDWEIAQLYRKMRDRSRGITLEQREAEALEKVRIKLEDKFQSKDLYFLMGNLKSHKNSFVIIGLMYPPIIKVEQLSFL